MIITPAMNDATTSLTAKPTETAAVPPMSAKTLLSRRKLKSMTAAPVPT